MSPAAKQLVRGLLTVDPKKRLGLDDLFNSAWIKVMPPIIPTFYCIYSDTILCRICRIIIILLHILNDILILILLFLFQVGRAAPAQQGPRQPPQPCGAQRAADHRQEKPHADLQRLPQGDQRGRPALVVGSGDTLQTCDNDEAPAAAATAAAPGWININKGDKQFNVNNVG